MQRNLEQALEAEYSGQVLILAGETDLVGAVELESPITGKLASGRKAETSNARRALAPAGRRKANDEHSIG